MRARSFSLGFSLLEMIVVLALMGLLAGLVAVNYESIISSFSAPSLEKTFSKAIREARHQASLTKNNVYLKFSKESYTFIIEGPEAKVLETIPTLFSIDRDKVSVEFIALIPPLEEERSWKWQVSDQVISSLEFAPYAVCNPVQVHLVSPDSENILTLDPFSSFTIQEELEPKIQ